MPPKLSPKHQVFFDTYVKTGDAEEAYMTAYPSSMKWTAETVKKKAALTLQLKGIQAHVKALKTPPKKKRLPNKKKATGKRANKSTKDPNAGLPGRPTELTPEKVKIIQAYPQNYYTEHKHLIPHILGLAKILDVTRETLYQWARNEQLAEYNFPDTFAKLKGTQEFELLQGGLSGDFKSPIVKMALQNNHDWLAKKSIEVTGAGGGPIQQEVSATQITADMDQNEANRLYQELIKQ